jgi:hypothetical protein
MVTDEKTIGKTMYEYMRKNGIPTDRRERKLTQMLNTNGELFVVPNYYLWFLLDNCYFKIDDIEETFIFYRSTAFTNFTNEFMDKKTIAASEQDKKFYKMVMNCSYESDGMNMEKFTKSRMINSDQAFIEHLSPNYVSTTLLTPDIKDSEGNIVKHAMYQVEKKPATFSCTSNLASFFYTLDNAKFWYLNIVFNGIYKCLDMSKLHFIEGVTDSQAWAVAGSPSKHITQAFEEDIIDKAFYNAFANGFFPTSFYTTDGKFPAFDEFREEHPEHEEDRLPAI